MISPFIFPKCAGPECRCVKEYRMTRLLLLAAFAVATPALAQEKEAQSTQPQRVRSVLLYGDQQCPKAESPDEIVVCANAGDSPYRIPKNLRERTPGPEGTSWVRRAELIDEVNRVGMPGSCSPVGSYGASGCTLQAIQQWAAERKAQKARESNIP
jgi:alkylation response protein AidB-like acyl-CoA dehydrogenase